MENVNITIRTEQFAPDGGADAAECVESRVRGTFRKDDEGIKICYEEPEASGLGKCRTVIVVSGGIITVRRSGETRSQMIFECGVKHDCVYKTAVMPFSLATEGITVRADETDVLPYKANLEYLLYADGRVGARNRMRITVEKDREKDREGSI